MPVVEQQHEGTAVCRGPERGADPIEDLETRAPLRRSLAELGEELCDLGWRESALGHLTKQLDPGAERRCPRHSVRPRPGCDRTELLGFARELEEHPRLPDPRLADHRRGPAAPASPA